MKEKNLFSTWLELNQHILTAKNETFEKDGRTYYALAPLYTNDGGHLNETGRKVVAEKLLYFLASLKKT